LFDIFGVLWNGFWQLLLNILVAINSVVGSPGIAIIIFTIFMRLLTVPFTLKALRSSRNMQAVQPLIKKVQREYGKDRAKQQEETMKIYRDYGINPAAGCFPMLLQLPIFIGLFAALSFVLPSEGNAKWIENQAQLSSFVWNSGWIGAGHASDFRQSFGWVTNLGAADPLFIWPVLSGLFQFFQSRMAMPKKDPNNPIDPQQRMMQNIMQFMPIYIVFISAGFPAGTVIYWAISSLFGAVLQYFITGFGSLPDMPGFKWLPHKEMAVPQALDPAVLEANAAKRKSGMFGKMMERALEAQEAQRAAQAAAKGGDSTTKTVPTPSSTGRTRPSKASTPVSQSGAGLAPPSAKAQAKARSIVSKAVGPSNGGGNGFEQISTDTKYASDARREAAGSGTGAPTNLPRKPKRRK
jgi:YidC/Oxa1 family membrane protein insertase